MKNEEKRVRFGIKLRERDISKDRLIEDLRNVSKKTWIKKSYTSVLRTWSI